MVDADMWNALENLQNPGVTASEVYMPLLHDAYDEGANQWCQSEIASLRAIFGQKWNAWIDQLGMSTISRTDSKLLQSSNHIDGPTQERLLQAGGESLLQEIAVSIHAVLKARKARGSTPSNADRGTVGHEDAASCSDTRVRGSLSRGGIHPAQGATGHKEGGAPTLMVADGAEDAPSSDLESDDAKSVASLDIASSERRNEEMQSDAEYDADVEDNAADRQQKFVVIGTVHTSPRSAAAPPILRSVEAAQDNVVAKANSSLVTEMSLNAAADEELKTSAAFTILGVHAEIQRAEVDAGVPTSAIQNVIPSVVTRGPLSAPGRGLIAQKYELQSSMHQDLVPENEFDIVQQQHPRSVVCAPNAEENQTQDGALQPVVLKSSFFEGDSKVSNADQPITQATRSIAAKDSAVLYGHADGHVVLETGKQVDVQHGSNNSQSVQGTRVGDGCPDQYDEESTDLQSCGGSSDETIERSRSWRLRSACPKRNVDAVEQELAPDNVPDQIHLNADSGAGANPCIPSGETGDDVNSPPVLVQKRVGGDAGEPNAKMDADCAGEKGSSTVAQFCTTSAGKRRRLTGADRVQHENVLVLVENAHGFNIDDAWVEENVERGRSWRPKSPAPVQPCGQVQQECVLDVATGRPGLQADTDAGAASGDLSGANGVIGESPNARKQKRMGGIANVSVEKQSAKEVGQRRCFSDEQWYAKSAGKRRRLAGADHGQSCTESVLPGNGGIRVPNTSFENANRHRRKGRRMDEPTVRGNDASHGRSSLLVERIMPVKISATYGKRLNTSAFGNNRVESNLSNQQSPMVPSCPRATSRNAGGRDGTSVHQRLGDGGKGAVVRTSIGENGIPGGADQSQSLIRRMPSKSRDADEFLYNPCANSDMPNPFESPKKGNQQIAEEAAARHVADASIAPNVVPVLKKLKVVDDGLNVPEEVAAAGKAGAHAKNNKRKRRAKQLKKESIRLLAAAKYAELSAQLPSALVPVPMPLIEVGVDDQDASAGTQILHRVKSEARKTYTVGGSVTTFRQTTRVPEGGSCNLPLRIVQREVLAAAVRQEALLAMVTARAEFSRKNSTANMSPNSQLRPPNRGVGPTQDE